MYIDFSEVQDSFALVPEGPVEATLTELNSKVGRDSGKPYLEWIFTVTEGPNAGAKLFYNTSLQPQALWMLKEMLKSAFGIEEDSLDGAFELDENELIGTSVICVVTHNEWNGSKHANVENVLPADDGGFGLR